MPDYWPLRTRLSNKEGSDLTRGRGGGGSRGKGRGGGKDKDKNSKEQANVAHEASQQASQSNSQLATQQTNSGIHNCWMTSTRQTNSHASGWILDSGASNHMTSNIKLFVAT